MKKFNHAGMAVAYGLALLIGAILIFGGTTNEPTGYLFTLNESIAAETGIATVPDMTVAPITPALVANSSSN